MIPSNSYLADIDFHSFFFRYDRRYQPPFNPCRDQDISMADNFEQEFRCRTYWFSFCLLLLTWKHINNYGGVSLWLSKKCDPISNFHALNPLPPLDPTWRDLRITPSEDLGAADAVVGRQNRLQSDTFAGFSFQPEVISFLLVISHAVELMVVGSVLSRYQETSQGLWLKFHCCHQKEEKRRNWTRKTHTRHRPIYQPSVLHGGPDFWVRGVMFSFIFRGPSPQKHEPLNWIGNVAT